MVSTAIYQHLKHPTTHSYAHSMSSSFPVQTQPLGFHPMLSLRGSIKAQAQANQVQPKAHVTRVLNICWFHINRTVLALCNGNLGCYKQLL